MFNQAGERRARVIGVDRIGMGGMEVQRKYETLRAIGLPPIITRAVIAGQRGYEATGEASCQGRDDAVNRPCPLAGLNLPTPISERLNLFHAGSKQDLASRLADTLHQSLVEQLETTAQVTQVRGAVLKTRPEPTKRHLAIH